MLRLLSRFVLEVLPYALTALIAAIIVPGFLSAHFHATQPARAVGEIDDSVGAVELVRGDHSAYAEQPSSNLSSATAPRQFFAK